jgi:predicted permease
VLSAAISTALPLQGETWIDSAFVPGDTRSPWERPAVNIRFVSADYLRTMGIRLLAGRTFSENDRQRQVAIISERLARTLWSNEDPVGRQIERNGGQRFEVIGVAGDVRADADKRPVAMVYRPYWDWAPHRVMVVARAARDPRSIAGLVRETIHRLDPDLPVPALRTMQEVLEESVAQRRFQMLLAAVFAATALLLASLGIYGVVSYSVARRTNEMGLRLALGARSRSLYAMVLRQAMTPVAIGLIAGLAGALAAGRVLSSLLYEVSPRDPIVIGAVALLLAATALAACLVPARRATRVDPLIALRYE